MNRDRSRTVVGIMPTDSTDIVRRQIEENSRTGTVARPRGPRPAPARDVEIAVVVNDGAITRTGIWKGSTAKRLED